MDQYKPVNSLEYRKTSNSVVASHSGCKTIPQQLSIKVFCFKTFKSQITSALGNTDCCKRENAFVGAYVNMGLNESTLRF